MSHSQFYCIMFILRRAWLNLLDERMTTGRVNQVVRFRINSAHIMYIIYSILFIQFVMFIVTYAKIVYTYILMWYIIYEWFTYYLRAYFFLIFSQNLRKLIIFDPWKHQSHKFFPKNFFKKFFQEIFISAKSK